MPLSPASPLCHVTTTLSPSSHAIGAPTTMSSIQSLLKTEKDAAEIVNEARRYRTSRLKSAKADSQKEIDEYKTQKEAGLTKFANEHTGLNESIEKESEKQVEEALKSIQQKLAEKRSVVVKMLVEAATKPTPEMHINA